MRSPWALGSLTRDPDPHFPTLYEVGENQGQLYLVREFVEGATLEQFVTARVLGVREGIGALAAVARAVQRVHGRGLAHRNLHPANILIAARGAPKLIGFGRVGMLARPGLMPPGVAGVPAESDVQALKEILGWLGAALGQPIPLPGSVDSPAAFAEALDSYLQEGGPARP
jgi:serine/threonine protein kinase